MTKIDTRFDSYSLTHTWDIQNSSHLHAWWEHHMQSKVQLWLDVTSDIVAPRSAITGSVGVHTFYHGIQNQQNTRPAVMFIGRVANTFWCWCDSYIYVYIHIICIGIHPSRLQPWSKQARISWIMSITRIRSHLLNQTYLHSTQLRKTPGHINRGKRNRGGTSFVLKARTNLWQASGSDPWIISSTKSVEGMGYEYHATMMEWVRLSKQWNLHLRSLLDLTLTRYISLPCITSVVN